MFRLGIIEGKYQDYMHTETEWKESSIGPKLAADW